MFQNKLLNKALQVFYRNSLWYTKCASDAKICVGKITRQNVTRLVAFVLKLYFNHVMFKFMRISLLVGFTAKFYSV